VVVGQDCVEAEAAAYSAAATHVPPLTYVSPYNDWEVRASLLTIACRQHAAHDGVSCACCSGVQRHNSTETQ
jgi:hypothetical protein